MSEMVVTVSNVTIWFNTTSVDKVTDSMTEVTTDNLFKSVLSIMLVITAILTFLGNVLVLLSFLVEKKLRSNFNLYILNLAVTDVLISVTAIPFYIVSYTLNYWPLGQIVCGLWIFCDWGMTFASMYTLVAISIDRYWASCWSIHYRTHNTRRRTISIILLVW